MKKGLIILFSMLLCVFCFAGCGKKEPEEPETIEYDKAVIGTWMESYWDSGYTFREDMTGKDIYWDQEFTYTALDGTLILTFTDGVWADKTFSYTVDGNVLRLTEILETPADGSAPEDPGTWEYTKTE